MIRHTLGFMISLCISAAGVLSVDAQSLEVLWSADHGAQVSAVAFSPDSTLVASGSSYAYGSQAWAKLWNAADGQPVDTYDDFSIQDSIVDVGISRPGQLLAVGYTYPDFYNGYARTDVYNIAGHAPVAQYNGSHLSFSGDGHLLATGGGYFVRSVYVHDLETGQLTEDVYTGGYIWSLALAPNGSYFATGTPGPDGIVRVWSVPGGQLLHTLTGAGAAIATVAVSPDSTLIAAGAGEPQGADGAIRIWKADTGQLVHYLPGHAARTSTVAFSPDGRKLLSYGSEAQVGPPQTLKVWRLRDEALLDTFVGVGGDVHYAPDGSAIVYASGTQVVVARAPYGVVGDLNCDGQVGFGDINPFVLALGGQAQYEQAHPHCDFFNADINSDGTVDFADVNPFVALLASS